MRKEFGIGSILSYLQQALSILIGIVYTPWLMRMLGQSEYGLYTTVASVVSMLSVLNLGFGSSYVRYYAQYSNEGNREKIYRLNGMYLRVFLCLAAVAALCGLWVRSNLDLVFDKGLSGEEYAIAEKLMTLLLAQLVFSFPVSVFTSIINAHERFVLLKSIGVLKTVLSPLVTVPLLMAGYGSVAMVFVSVILNLTADAVYIIYVVVIMKERFRLGYSEPKLFINILRYTSLVALHLIVDQLNWNVDRILLTRFKGTSETAIYSAGFSIYQYYLTIGVTLSSMFIPKVHKTVEAYKQDIKHLGWSLTQLFAFVGRMQYYLLLCVALGFLFFGQEFIRLWIGEEYNNAYWVTVILMFAGMPDLIQNIGIEIQRAQDLHKFRAFVYVAMAVVNVVLSVSLCQRYGAIGSVTGTAISLLLVQGVVINIYYYRKCHLDVVFFWRNILSITKGALMPILLGVLLNHVGLFDSWIKLAVALVCYVVVYIISMWKFGISASDKTHILQWMKCNRT